MKKQLNVTLPQELKYSVIEVDTVMVCCWNYQAGF